MSTRLYKSYSGDRSKDVEIEIDSLADSVRYILLANWLFPLIFNLQGERDEMSLDGVNVSRKGPRIVEMQLGDDGYGFHMYTNKQLKGQYVKTVSETGNAIRAGLMVGDRVVEVDGESVEGKSHQEVVSLIRKDSGGAKQLLVIDRETEEIFKRQGRKVSVGSYVEIMEAGPGGAHTLVSCSIHIHLSLCVCACVCPYMCV